MNRFHFYERYGTTDLYKDYDRAGADVVALVQASPRERVVLDLSGIEFLGYSYSKATFVPALRLASGDPEGGARVVAFAEDALDLGELVAALEKFKQSLVVLAAPDGRTADGRVVGDLADHLRDTWSAVAANDGATTADLADLLGETLQNTNQRLKKLGDRGLIRRARSSSPTGGWEWRNNMP